MGSTERSSEPVHPFSARVAAADALLEVYSNCASAEEYYYAVLLPNILPESFPEDHTPGVTWIGAKARRSIEQSRLALADHITQLLHDSEISDEVATVCADTLQLPLNFPEAQIIQLRHHS